MRHSRRAVMAERYKLYAKKNIFNSRYLVRNLQIGMLALVMIALIIGTVVLITSDSPKEKVVVNKGNKKATVSVKDALFSNQEATTETEEVFIKEEQTTVTTTESIFAEKVQTKLENKIVEVADSVAIAEEEIVEEPKSEFDNKCIANVEETLNIRKGPGAETEFVGQMNNGAIAIVEGTDGEWTKIKSGDVEGYVLTEYILTGDSAEEFAKDYVTLCGTVLEDGVNIRAEKSTESEILTVMDKDDTIIVMEIPEEQAESEEEITVEDTVEADTVENSVATEIANESTTQTTESETVYVNSVPESESVPETEEEIEWIPVLLEDGKTGYVSADLIEIDKLYEIAVSAEELQRRAEEEAEKKAAEEAARQAAAQAAQQSTNTTNESSNSSNNSSTTNSSSNESNNSSYEGATTEPVTATESGEYIGTFTITAYCGCSKCGSGNNRTASGTVPTEGRTIAADTSILPFGTQVVIGGVVYTVEDRGSGVSGNHIDIFFATHSRALAFGRKTMKVYRY